MSCRCAKQTDEWHGWECSITNGPCMFLYPDSKACAKEYGEGPDAEADEQDNEDDQEQEELEKAAIMIARHCNEIPCSECKIKDFIKCDTKSDYIMTPYGWGR
ncbi:hypothetical protein QTL86_11265 [Cellulosilyticum sp. ST5]|uniref:hypothetical protein n=1 Tax=Cellulosilyticum sp. ST5 TaxID=3055805 RepID=UPI00397787A2